MSKSKAPASITVRTVTRGGPLCYKAFAMANPWLIVTGVFAPNGGQDRANLALAEHVAGLGRETHVVAFRVAPELAALPNVRVHRVPQVLGRYALSVPLLGSRGIVESLRLGGGARVVVNGGNCLAPRAIDWVHYVHAADLASGRRGIHRAKNAVARSTEKVALSSARLVIANSERTRRDLVEHVGVDPSKIHVVYLGVDADKFRPLARGERDEARAALGWDERPRAVFVGAMGDDRKGFDTVYKAWVRLAAGASWDADLVVCGAGRRLAEWRERAQEDGLGARVSFLGFRTDVARIVAASDMMLAAPRYEPYGLNVNEALCCGVPAITTAVSGVAEEYPEALRDWVLPDADDDLELSLRIRRIRASLGALPPALGALSRRLRARTWDVVARDIVALCEGEASTPRAGAA
jgi:glycosyltransferase involved in cell wall biosynthesis